MLVLTRKLQQGLVVGDDVVIKVLGVKSGQVRLGIEAPKSVKVHRSEVFDATQETAIETTEILVDLDELEGKLVNDQ